MREKRLGFRRKQHAGPGLSPVERLDPEVIARDMNLVRPQVRDHDREHAVQPLQHPLEPVALVEVEEHFGVGPAAESKAGGFELGFVVEGVIDLAVERDDDRAGRVHHRLMALLGQVENLEPMKADRRVCRRVGIAGDLARRSDRRICPRSSGPRCRIARIIAADHAGVGGRAVEVDESGNAAHGYDAVRLLSPLVSCRNSSTSSSMRWLMRLPS